MSGKIKLDTVATEENVDTVYSIVDEMRVLWSRVKKLPFGEKGECESTGPCADSMKELTINYRETIGGMINSMKEFADYVTDACSEIENLDSKVSAKIGVDSKGG